MDPVSVVEMEELAVYPSNDVCSLGVALSAYVDDDTPWVDPVQEISEVVVCITAISAQIPSPKFLRQGQPPPLQPLPA